MEIRDHEIFIYDRKQRMDILEVSIINNEVEGRRTD